MKPTAHDRILDALRVHGSEVKQPDAMGNTMAQCPAHDDRNPSLSIRQVGARAKVKCFAGCEDTDVLAALGLTVPDLFDNRRDETYPYPDGVRVKRTPDKTFPQENATKGKKSLFRATFAGEHVYFTEGESDVLCLESIGIEATSARQGASTPPDRWDFSPLRGKEVTVWADADEKGRLHAHRVAAILVDVAESVCIVESPYGKDVTDHIMAGHPLDDVKVVPHDVPDEVPARRARITRASEIEIEPVKWMWNDDGTGAGRIPAGSLSVAAGREGTGKSSFGIWLVAQLTPGQLTGCWRGIPANALYVAVEDSWKFTLGPRLIVAGADLDRVGRFDVIDTADEELSLSLPHDNALFEKAIVDFGAKIVVIDPLMSVIGERIDTHRERDVRTALDPLARIADRTGAVIIGIAHFNKGNGTDAATLITGSGAFKNVPRSVFGFARDDENDCRVVSQVKNSLGRDDLPSLKYTIESATIATAKGDIETGKFVILGESDRTVADVLRESARSVRDDDGDDMTPALRFIVNYIEQHGDENAEVPSRDVIAAGAPTFTEKELVKARNKAKAKISTRKGGRDAGWYWGLVMEDSGEDSEDSTNRMSESSESSRESSPEVPPLPTLIDLPIDEPSVLSTAISTPVNCRIPGCEQSGNPRCELHADWADRMIRRARRSPATARQLRDALPQPYPKVDAYRPMIDDLVATVEIVDNGDDTFSAPAPIGCSVCGQEINPASPSYADAICRRCALTNKATA